MRSKRCALISVSLLLAILFSYAIIGSRMDKNRAERLLQELQSVELGTASFQEAYGIAKARGGEMLEGCTPLNCTFAFDVENATLHQLFLAPQTELWINLDVKGGRVTRRSLAFQSVGESYFGTIRRWLLGSAPTFEASALAAEYSQLDYPNAETYHMVLRRDSSGRPWQAICQFTTAATPKQRQSALGFNLGCFTKIGGCRDSNMLAPTAWEASQDQ